MSYMGSIAIRGKSIVGSPSEAIMPPEFMFQVLAEEPNSSGLVQVGERALNVSSVYSAGPEVMGRRK